nr:MAG TPA: hypothetical protein [Caudoviricetes sp.]
MHLLYIISFSFLYTQKIPQKFWRYLLENIKGSQHN